ncbi:MAG TPA: DNA repair protein RadA [Longimicrobiales bacterium]|nr:DNA repair protein RadA [Longimicrobiales bacterium]
MARAKTRKAQKTLFYCTECGGESARWEGQCPACREWNTLVEAPRAASGVRRQGSESAVGLSFGDSEPIALASVTRESSDRLSTGIGEIDFVLGGGLVPGSIVLLGGEPGIGKSTLLLQVAASARAARHDVLYVSGEESAGQVRMRADRLAPGAGEVLFLCETSIERVLRAIEEQRPAIAVIDSIQTMYDPQLDSAAGSVTQVRECAARLQRLAKESGTTIFLVGHVTKEGVVAGPRTLEHMVDTVLYFESGPRLDHRVLRATKNRFGGVDEIGVFRMVAEGLQPVANPSELFLDERSAGAGGSAVFPAIEGTRPLLVEVQALVSKSAYGAPQRVAQGFDRQRLSLLLAVLEKRSGLAFGDRDVFVNVVGGLRLAETAADLAVVAAVASSALDRALPDDAVFLGEVGLSGEVRSIAQVERRLAEARRLGFSSAFVPSRAVPSSAPDGLRVVGIENVNRMMERLFR